MLARRIVSPFFLSACFAAISAIPVKALQLVDAENTTAPGDAFNDQFFSLALPWDNVGQVNGLSAVYLGDVNNNGTYWVLTAYHVASGLPAAVNFGGTDYTTVAESYVRLNNLANLGSGPTDLVMFRLDLNSNPSGLYTLSLLTSALSVGDDLYYVGYGGGIKRWGFNDYDGVANIETSPVSYGTVRTIWTDFDSGSSNPNEAQAISGDSGGAAFYYDSLSGTWKLAGIIDAVDTSNSPATTYSASIAYYNSRIVAAAVPEPSAMLLLTCGFAVFGGARRRR
jgi:hypothetical protein